MTGTNTFSTTNVFDGKTLDEITKDISGVIRVALVIDTTASREKTIEGFVEDLTEKASELTGNLKNKNALNNFEFVLYSFGGQQVSRHGACTIAELPDQLEKLRCAAGLTQVRRSFEMIKEDAKSKPVHSVAVFSDTLDGDYSNKDKLLAVTKGLGVPVMMFLDNTSDPSLCRNFNGTKASDIALMSQISEVSGLKAGDYPIDYKKMNWDFSQLLETAIDKAQAYKKGEINKKSALQNNEQNTEQRAEKKTRKWPRLPWKSIAAAGLATLFTVTNLGNKGLDHTVSEKQPDADKQAKVITIPGFAHNSAVLTETMQDEIKCIANENPGASVIIDAHASTPGTVDYNQVLTEQRAAAARAFAAKSGLQVIGLSACGEVGQDSHDPAHDRRLELTVL